MISTPIFLTADWRHLVMANYAVDPDILRARVPTGTELDAWNGTVYVSLVGFNFLNTRIRGLRIPFHVDFEEINLRFYVRRKAGDEWRRGVVFVKEIVPRPAIAWVARTLYNENYIALPTRHVIDGGDPIRVRYEWRFQRQWNSIEALAPGAPQPLIESSEAQFISEHYWGYTTQRNGGTMEYRVDHSPWRVWQASDATVDIDVEALYGEEFAEPLARPPTSVFIADGSAVTVSTGAVCPVASSPQLISSSSSSSFSSSSSIS